MAIKGKEGVEGSYGIGEWYGKLFVALSNTDRRALVEPADAMPCPFRIAAPEAAPSGKGREQCTKKGGICSIRKFPTSGSEEFGPLVTTCPSRFLDGGKIFRFVGETILGSPTPILLKEIPFLIRPAAAQRSQSTKEDVGRIDVVLVRPNSDPLDWCALEMQAVYFTGRKFGIDFGRITAIKGSGMPLPAAGRRPDFRSSGPKRLMPQLQIKVPTLRRWGKKLAVIVDRPFFDALGEMDRVHHVSNCDIVWFVVHYEETRQEARLELHDVRFTTLERAVEGLTSGVPVSLPDFETRLRDQMGRKRKNR